ncbi:hypothetical protein [Desulfotruncus alcoholivorax]|uniref:hypothetical protein n=1 Tax=Desulfotruncus alcoholivorax TaxID=265477 RepID=UPI00146FBBBC|nr:hypothetical protein [Desulfotruncus alcoholivorax]
MNRLFALTPHRVSSLIADRFHAFLYLILGIRHIAVVFRPLRPLGLILGADKGVFRPASHIEAFVQRLNVLDGSFGFDVFQRAQPPFRVY